MIVIVDIDHTISDARWRDDLIGNWDEYYLAGDEDKPIKEMIHLLQSLELAGHTLIGLTGRPEKWRQLTVSWLFRHGVPFDEVLMRPDDDFRKSPDLKIALLTEWLDNSETDVLLIDDREDITSRISAELNITTLQCRARRVER